MESDRASENLLPVSTYPDIGDDRQIAIRCELVGDTTAFRSANCT